MYALIVNPISGNGRGKRELPRVEALLREENVPYQLFEAARKGEMRALARQAVESGMEGIVAVGGDGSLFEIINGMAGSELALLFACCGTGNDFIKAVHLPKDPVEALRLQLHTPLSRIDLGRMNEMYFLNVSGTGFDVEVLRQAEKYKQRYKGLGVYLRGVRDAIRHFRPLEARIAFDDAELTPQKFTIISIGNGRYIGGRHVLRAHCAGQRRPVRRGCYAPCPPLVDRRPDDHLRAWLVRENALCRAPALQASAHRLPGHDCQSGWRIVRL